MKIITIVGARPQFIKAASVSRAIAKHNRKALEAQDRIEELIIHTGQHYDNNMSTVFFTELNIPEPHLNLGIGSGPHGRQTGKMLMKIEEVLLAEKPDWMLVYGDTNSTLAGALAAVKLHIPVAHVEAGLRSFNRIMPEEHNRVLTDHCSSVLFCPTDTAVMNLRNEGITKGVHNVGDVMYDSILYNTKLAVQRSTISDKLNLSPNSYTLATIHRAENTDNMERLQSIFSAMDHIAAMGLPVILPLHLRTQKIIRNSDISVKHVTIIDPVSYLDMLMLEKNAKLILTDSGGVQKEAYWMKVPCITLRDETEWIETAESGWNVIAGTNMEKIVSTACSTVWPNSQDSIFGDGLSAVNIVTILSNSRTQFHKSNSKDCQ